MKSLSAILSGGKSRRMGKNKALLAFDELTAIEKISQEMMKVSDDIIVISNNPEAYSMLPYPIFQDIHPGLGPLAGLESVMKNSVADLYILAACDMPFISSKVYEFLLKQAPEYDAVIPVYKNREHPLSGVYNRSILPIIEKNIEDNILSMRSLYKQLNVNFVSDFEQVASKEALNYHFFNMNVPEEYQQALNIFEQMK